MPFPATEDAIGPDMNSSEGQGTCLQGERLQYDGKEASGQKSHDLLRTLSFSCLGER